MEKNTAALNEEVQNGISAEKTLETQSPQKEIKNEETSNLEENSVLPDTSFEEATTEEEDATSSGDNDYTKMSLAEIVALFQSMIEKNDHQELYRNAESIKAAFYKTLRREKIALGGQSAAEVSLEGKQINSEGTDNNDSEKQETVSNNPFLELERGFKELYSTYKNNRMEYISQQEREKEDNLAKKLQIIDELKSLLEKSEDVNRTFPEFRELQNRWKSIGMVPQARAKDVWETYQHGVEMFYDYIKINNEFRDLDFKKNLELKSELCSKAEALEYESNIVNAFKSLQKLHEEWKEIGPVAKEDREVIWERFKLISSIINKKHQHFFEKLKDDQKKNLAAKTELCESAEEIASANVQESNEWNSLSDKMEKLQAKWKTIGFAAKKDNQKIYDRFRAACDKFYGAKRDYYANFKNVMAENLKKKEDLCAQAEAIMDSEDWKKSTDQLIALQKTWKEVGPVARKQSDVVWKRFRAACDNFFERKGKHYGAEDEKYEENLQKKNAILLEIESFVIREEKSENIEAMRAFQQRWNEIGFVPFKDKEKIQSAFNKLMNEKFKDIRSLDGEKKLNKFKKMVNETRNSGKGDRSLKFEREKLIQKFRKTETDIATLENNMGFFAKSKNADAFIKEIEKKIEIAKEELKQLEEKIKIIEQQFN